MRSDPKKAQVPFATDHEESTGVVDFFQPGEVQVASIHDVECARLKLDLIEDASLAHVGCGNPCKDREISLHVKKCMEFHASDRGLVVRSSSPREELQTQLDDRRIQGIDRHFQICQETVVLIEHTRSGNQAECHVLKNQPRPMLVGIRQG